MKHTHIIIYILLTTILCSACSREDDVDEIFPGKTWYMSGIVVNGITSSQETAQFYQEDNTYYISFSSGTFKGVLSSGVNISGTYTADGKHQSISFTLDAPSSSLSQFDLQIYNRLKGMTAYSSGADWLHLGDANGNRLIFARSRNQHPL